jgi:hypothetical protein
MRRNAASLAATRGAKRVAWVEPQYERQDLRLASQIS